jgi:stage II sporulation protein D (peptidoglycan lytic transglycosylase)
MRSLLFALLMAVLATAGLAQASGPATLRIGLWTLWHDKGVSVAPTQEGVATMRTCAIPDRCTAAALNKQIQFRAAASGLALENGMDAESIGLAGSFTLTAHGESLALHNPVRISARNGELIFAVTLPVESYVERVLASESGAADSHESLKALAIVVRSFALHQHHGHGDYDLCDSTHCQMLRWGIGSGRQAAAHEATLATAGETLWYHGQRAEAWFHQNCGGRTASPSEVWSSASQKASHRAMPWLVSRADPYCTANGAREWSSGISLTDLTSALAAAGLVRPGWKTLIVARRGESGRAVSLMIGASEVSAEEFRLAVGRALGWNRILSNWYEVSPEGDDFLFHGRGSGHGVGLCQAGNAAMSALGRDSSQILAQYFPGAIAADEATGQPWQPFRGQGFALQTLTSADAAYLPQLSQALSEAETLSGLQPTASITVRAFRSTTAFRDATLAPGWDAAFTEGNWIATQPLSTLGARKLLVPILRHEFLHALVEAQTADGTPLWLREGLVEAWSDLPANGASGSKPSGPPPAPKLDETDRALAHAATEAKSQAAHRVAAWYAKQLLDRYGRNRVVSWLHSGLPPQVLAEIH